MLLNPFILWGWPQLQLYYKYIDNDGIILVEDCVVFGIWFSLHYKHCGIIINYKKIYVLCAQIGQS